MKNSTGATLVGIVAILLWSLLALLTTASGTVPPFQLVAICFAIASAIGAISVWRLGTGLSVFRQPIQVWLLGVGGLFGYHFFYFTALRHAPPVEAGLIAYLWPLLIILFSALLPGERLRIHHVIGGMLGLTGAFMIIGGGDAAGGGGGFLAGFEINSTHTFGYVSAGLCAIIWSGYSVLSRRFANVPSEVVTGFCAVACVLALVAHLLLETTVIPDTTGQWLAVLGLGLGPVGLAFYVWDYGVKKGNIQVLGAASYAAPVLSTLALIAAGFAQPTWAIALATLLVTLGAVVAAKDMILKRRTPSDPT
ncbi:MAG: EamA family transporter [Rhizobiaceae bacterium]|nr:EamA family transporter [Rhizobiaceae bacterium]